MTIQFDLVSVLDDAMTLPVVVGKTTDVKKIPVRATILSALSLVLYVAVALFSAGYNQIDIIYQQ